MTYLFLGIPNFCGSTLTHNLLATCPDIVILKDPRPLKEDGSDKWRQDFVEGNCCALGGYTNLRGPHSMEANMEHVYNKKSNYDWKFIKKTWDKNWNNQNPTASIKLQKTPADIFRIQMMTPYFPNSKWIISVRNPYAYVESIMRKATFNMEPIRQLDQICFHVLRTLEIQLENIEFLKNNAYVMTYEDFCFKPYFHRAKMGEWLPGLEQMIFDVEFNVKGTSFTKFNDDTEQRIQDMIDLIPNIIEMINEYFIPKQSLLEQWGYSIIQPTNNL